MDNWITARLFAV